MDWGDEREPLLGKGSGTEPDPEFDQMEEKFQAYLQLCSRYPEPKRPLAWKMFQVTVYGSPVRLFDLRIPYVEDALERADKRVNAKIDEMIPAVHRFREEMRKRVKKGNKRWWRRLFDNVNEARDLVGDKKDVPQKTIMYIWTTHQALGFLRYLIGEDKPSWARFAKQATRCKPNIWDVTLTEDTECWEL